MTWVDFLIIGVVLVSAVIGLVRGFVKEALSIVGWIASLLIAWQFTDGLANLLSNWIKTPNLQFLVGFVTLFLLSMLIFALIIFFATKLIQRTGLTAADRTIGIVFGVLRGVFVVLLLVGVAGLTTLPQSDGWRGSLTVNRFQTLTVWLSGYLPASIAKNFIYR
ncbi:MAG: CvpA family protein [Gammaproteobacteria bacterium]|nr:CvpA family protein [Gammaproteobacteria bacterium]